MQVSNFAIFRIALSYGRLQHNLTQIDILQSKGYGHPMKPFFIEVLGLGRQFGQINFDAFGVFLVDLSAPILVPWIPCLVFHESTKKTLYPNPKYFLGH